MISIYDSANLLRAAIKNNDIRLASVQRSNAVSSQKTVLYRNHREDRVRVVARERKGRGEEMGKTKACSTIVRLMEKKKKNKKKEKKKKRARERIFLINASRNSEDDTRKCHEFDVVNDENFVTRNYVGFRGTTRIFSRIFPFSFFFFVHIFMVFFIFSRINLQRE